MKAWPSVRLGEVLRVADRSVPVSDLAEVNIAGVYSFGRGLFKRGPLTPSETSYRYFNRLVADDFVISQPKAWEGALARVPADFDGWYLSPVFPAFRADASRLLSGWLEWYCKRRNVWFELQQLAKGLGARRETVSPEQFLSLKIPLPPLPEQQRLVARIDEAAAQVAEARSLGNAVLDDIDGLLVALAHRSDLTDGEKEERHWTRVRIDEVLIPEQDLHKVLPDGSYPNCGIYSFGKGIFEKPPINGLSSSASSLNRLRHGQFIYSRLFAFEGAYAMVGERFDGCFVSNEYPTFKCRPDAVIPEFLVAYLKPKSMWARIAEGSKGLGDRRQRVQPAQLLQHVLWLPPLNEQQRLAAVMREASSLAVAHATTRTELDALLPAVLDRAFAGTL